MTLYRGFTLNIKNMLTYKQRALINEFVDFFKFRKVIKGQRCYIDKTAQFIGKECVVLGNNVCIGMNANININGNREDKIKRLFIGDNSYIGRNFFVSTGKIVKIGDYFMASPNCSLIGQDHNISNPFFSYLNSKMELTKEIIIEDNVWLGDNVTVVGNVKIGRGSIIGAKSLVNKDIPPFSIAVGNPCKVIKRFDFAAKKWVRAEDFNGEKLIPSKEEYVKIVRENSGNPDMPIIAATNRFGGI
ncbi:acyltransferase [Treponema pectinovorum]|uniref:acyltransferase n=1 Tax=Treponema pectinovorum TaxID=164 RepID=UPI0011C7C44F|nr:acyltransferase [Treponema pectinovorum]